MTHDPTPNSTFQSARTLPAEEGLRKSTQLLMPGSASTQPDDRYDIYPEFPVGSGAIRLGFDALAEAIATHSHVILDGYVGTPWELVRGRLDRALRALGIEPEWTEFAHAYLPEEEINRRVAPFLGGDDPLFGTRFRGTLRDFVDPDRLRDLAPRPRSRMSILYGCGSALAPWKGTLVYFDLPKNELQFRSRAGWVCNLGRTEPQDLKVQYKRFYFVDWVALNRHKAELLPRIDIMVDGQRAMDPAFCTGDTLRDALRSMSRNVFRVRPWFEPGPWGGNWILNHVPGLSPEVPNYAWSFELIVPENGLILVSDSKRLEVSFDCLMFQDHRAVLGDCADRFQYEFPIRFDFLDTFDGGNLSLQCHPRPEFIKWNFGETFTQDETYYILDCKPEARVYLGFRDGLDPKAFRAELEASYRDAAPVDVERYVNTEPAHKHDLFLIPNGTIHCSGKDNLVLEISSTPYIFTFKMYDWMRMDLDGRPRPLNIDRAFDNLYFDRQGERVRRELISQPRTLHEENGRRLVHLPTHPDHFYDVHRLEFHDAMEIETQGSPHVLNLVEGTSVLLETEGGLRRRFHYAETFVVPAAARHYRLLSDTGRPVKVVKAFIKPEKAREQ